VSNFILVDTNSKLRSAKKDISTSRLIGIDTEYDSFRYFREKLCLIQIQTDKKTYLFDPLNHLEIIFLEQCFSDRQIPKIIHAGDNDIRLLNRDYGFEFNSVFDTQKAASILGYKHLSLASVIQQALGIELLKTKRIQRSQWDIRPLSEEQKEYAAQDIEHLFGLYERFSRELITKNLMERADRAFKEIASVRWNEKVFDPYGFFRISGYKELKRQQKERLRSLYEWRFLKAKSTNTAVFMILSDQNLLDLSRLKPESLIELRKTGKLPEGRIKKFGNEIIEILNAPNSDDYSRPQQVQFQSRA
jgi:ribonuclease D